MTSRERLMATLRGEPVDRPAVNFYEIGGFDVDPSDPDEFNVYHDPSWRPLLQLAEERTDLIRMRSAVRSRSWDPQTAVPPSGGQRRRPTRYAVLQTRHQYVEDQWHCTRMTIRIGGRTLSSTTRRSPGGGHGLDDGAPAQERRRSQGLSGTARGVLRRSRSMWPSSSRTMPRSASAGSSWWTPKTPSVRRPRCSAWRTS